MIHLPETLQLEQRFPDLELRDHSGNPRSLSELAAGDPLVAHFYRGWFCPKERAYFRSLLELQREVEVAYTRIVSISVEPVEVQAAFAPGSAPAGRFFRIRSASTSTISGF